MTTKEAEEKALEHLVGLLDSKNESIALNAAKIIYVDRPHAVAVAIGGMRK